MNSWIDSMLVPVLQHRLDSKYTLDEVKHRLLLNKVHYAWSGSTLCNTTFYAFGFGYGPSGNEAEIWKLFYVGNADNISVIDVGLHAKPYSKTWDKFAYEFSRNEVRDDICHLDALHIVYQNPQTMLEELKMCIEHRADDEQLYLGNGIVILNPKETFEEVLVERDLYSYCI